MPTALTDLKKRLAADRRRALSLVLLAALHLAAFGVLLWSEDEPAARAAFLLAWACSNFFWFPFCRAPLTSPCSRLRSFSFLSLCRSFNTSPLLWPGGVSD